MSSQSLNTASTTSLSPSIANLNALASPRPLPAPIQAAQQRRLAASSVPPPTSLNLPEPVYGHPPSPRRPHSPLRNDLMPRRHSQDSHSGDDDDDSDDDNDDADRTWVRSQSPTASMTQFAANLAQRVNSLISPAAGIRPLPSDAELEAQAQRERDRSRREAELILTREAEERRAKEERALAMMNSGSPQALPPPRGRSQTLPNPPSPASSAKDGVSGWWQATKTRLTPTKELTPAQKVIEEARSRPKEKKSPKGNDNGSGHAWPASGASKYTDPAYVNLKIPSSGPAPRTSSSPTSPTANRTPVKLSPAPASQPINLSPISLQRGTSPGGSPAREQPPMYASFTTSGTLDIPGTLLTIAKRFEKLERWTVSHVRALEERMGDVERWLVDKENERTKEKEQEKSNEQEKTAHLSDADARGIRDDITELQGRITELGREMARFATSPAVLSSNTAAQDSPELHSAPPTESMIAGTHESSFSSMASSSPPESAVSTPAMNILTTPRRMSSLTARESTSPPLAKNASRSGTRLPYPTGDYTSPGDVISPTHTPASSPPPTSRPSSVVLSGLPPMLSSPFEFSSAPASPPTRVTSPTPSGLPPPSVHGVRRGSVSPTPLSGARKRYTVALGGPIVAPPEVEAEYERARAMMGMGTAYFSSTAESSEDDDDGNERYGGDDDDEHGADTVGKKSAERMGVPVTAGIRLVGSGADDGRVGQSGSAASPRARALSTYNSSSSLQSNQAALSRHRLRSQSTDFRTDRGSGIGSGGGVVSGVGVNGGGGDHPPGRFVDPLILRRQSKSEKTRDNKPLVGAGKKVPVGQLVAFFDSERSSR